MKYIKPLLLSGIFLVITMTGCKNESFETGSYSHEAQYDGKHEWRAAWIATVDNIDWPSSPGLTPDQQKEELVEYLDLFKELNFNAIILQVRPTADAFYKSEIEPWSLYLTGHQDTPPDPLYDPLDFAIEEAHKRGMELHAWLNPYRVLQDSANIQFMSDDHLYFQKPELFVRHGKKLYFDPAYPETREFLTTVVKDIVTRYDLDGIHFDDYFYPYNDFEDSISFSIHSRGYDITEKMAWRRENVNLVIEMLRDTIKKTKPHIKFGISPYAVWRNLAEDPRGSDTKSFGYTNYDHLHADILHWMEMGWLDYILPQLYFNIGYENADFEVLAKWWDENSFDTPLYGGLGTYLLNPNSRNEPWRTTDEIIKQTKMLRGMPNYHGVCYFSAKNFKDNRMEINSVMKDLYPNPALVPPLRSFTTNSPGEPKSLTMKLSAESARITWKDNPDAMYHALYRFNKDEIPDFSKGDALIQITGGDSFELTVDNTVTSFDYYATSLDRLFNESRATKVRIQ